MSFKEVMGIQYSIVMVAIFIHRVGFSFGQNYPEGWMEKVHFDGESHKI